MSYLPPQDNIIDFKLHSYSPITGGVVDFELAKAPPKITLSAYLAGGAYLSNDYTFGKGLSAKLSAGSEVSIDTFVRTRGMPVKLSASSSISTRLNLIASVKSKLESEATLKVGMLRLIVPPGVYEITADDYFRKNQPAKSDELANYITVYTNPLKPSDTVEEVYRTTGGAITIPARDTIQIKVRYNTSPVIQALASIENPPSDVSISEANYYAWGAELSITNNGDVDAEIGLVIVGKTLQVQGQQVITAKDDGSIRDNGLIEFKFPDNPLVQTPEIADKIANQLLAFSIPRRDVSVEWRGNPALMLADKIQVPEYQKGLIDKRGLFYIIRQNYVFDGGMRTTTEGRKIK